jgi:hypothetical protein
MSHYVEMDVQFETKNEADLIAALEEQFGEGTVEIHPEGAALYGYHGDDRSKANQKSRDYAPPCELVIRRKHVGSAANDVGFRRTPEGTYKSYISDYDNGSTFNKSKQNAVAQEYAVRVAERALKQDGWSVTRQRLNDGSVKVIGTEKIGLVKTKTW